MARWLSAAVLVTSTLTFVGPVGTIAASPGRGLSWGYNGFGNIGDGTADDDPANRVVPAPMLAAKGGGDLLGVRRISGGSGHGLALLADGHVAAWGHNNYSQIGDDTTTNRPKPILVHDLDGAGSLSGVTDVATGSYWSMALLSSGGVVTWGGDDNGVLGDGGGDDKGLPVHVKGIDGSGLLSDVESIAGSWGAQAAAVLSDGSVVTWGDDVQGALGNGPDTGSRSVPGLVTGVGGTGTLTDVASVALGSEFGLALLDDGRVVAWGDGRHSQLGDGGSSSRQYPDYVLSPDGSAALDNVKAICAGQMFSLALLDDGTILGWGTNSAGYLGDGTKTTRPLPVHVQRASDGATLDEIVEIACGVFHALARTSAGGVYAWGDNSRGALGDGTTKTRTQAVRVVGIGGSGLLKDVLGVAAGVQTSFAIESTGEDAVAPVASLALDHGAISTSSRDVIATIEASDTDSGLAVYRARLGGEAWPDWSDWPSGASVDVPMSLPDGDGPHAVEAQVRDSAGNTSVIASAAIELDSSVASEFVAVSIAGGAEFTRSRDVVLDLFAPGGIARMKVANDSGGLASAAWEPYVAHRAWTLGNPNGVIVTKNVYVRFSSGPGDAGETASDDIVIDPLPPITGAAAVAAADGASDDVAPMAVSSATIDTRARDQVGGSGVTAMQVSTSGTFVGAVWEDHAADREVPFSTSAATTVYWRFRDAAGNVSSRSKRVLATAARATVPTQIAPFHGTDAPSLRPTFRWSSVTGSGKYRVQVDQEPSFASPVVDATTTGTTFRPATALSAGTDLVWRVRRGTGAWSPAFDLHVPAATPPTLTAPGAGATVASLSPRLSWKVVSGADRYAVQLSRDRSLLVGVSATQTATNQLTLASTARRTTYVWRVRARVAGTWGAWSAPRSFKTPAIGVPILVAPNQGASISLPVDLDWADLPGATSYRVQVCSTSSCGTVQSSATANTSAYRLSGGVARGTHWWRVKGVTATGADGAWSVARSFER